MFGDQWFEQIARALLSLNFHFDEGSLRRQLAENNASYVRNHEKISRIVGSNRETFSVTEGITVDMVEFPDGTTEYVAGFTCSESHDSYSLTGGSGGSCGSCGGHRTIARNYRQNLDEVIDDLPDLARRGRWLTCMELQKDHVCEILYGVDLAQFMLRKEEFFAQEIA